MVSYGSAYEFYLRAQGAELVSLPNLPLVLKPLIDTTLHRLHSDTVDTWVFRASQRAGKSYVQRPKVAIYCEGHKHLAFTFKMPKKTRLYQTSYELFNDLEAYGTVNASLNVPFRVAARPMTEMETLEHYNEERRKALRQYEATSKPPDPRKHNQWASTEAELMQRLGVSSGR